MPWPFLTRARHERELDAIQREMALRLAAAEARARIAEQERDTFKGYYERLADDTLFRRGEATAPVHDPPDRRDSMPNKLGRAFGLVGNFTGAPISGPSHAADATTKR